jgi:hypothetical protein
MPRDRLGTTEGRGADHLERMESRFLQQLEAKTVSRER